MAEDSPHTADDLMRARAQHWPLSVTPVTQLMVTVLRLSSLVLETTRQCVEAHGLSFTEFEVLIALRGAAPPHALLPTDLYGAVLISSGGLTKVLYALQERGLIRRGESEEDRRSKPVGLTARGRNLAERAMADVIKTDKALVARALSDPQVDRLTRLLRKLLAAAERGRQ